MHQSYHVFKLNQQNHIFITGSTGFVGNAVIGELLKRGYRVRALVRTAQINRPGVDAVVGDLFDDAVLDAALVGCARVIHLVGIIRQNPKHGQTFRRIHYEASKRVIDATSRAGIRRYIHMSALGARSDSQSDYASTKALAEEYLKSSGLDFTILRPSLIHGPGGEFVKMMTDWARGRKPPYLFMPYFGHGVLGQRSAKVQPIYVGDVARAFVDCLSKSEAIGQTIDLTGPEQMTWPQMYAIASRIIRGKPKRSVGIPIWYAKLLTRIVPASLLPFNKSQVVMAGEDNVSDADMTGNRSLRELLLNYSDQLF